MPSRPMPQIPIRQNLINRTRVVFLILTVSFSVVIFFATVYVFYHLWNSLLNRSRTISFDTGAPSKLQRFTYKELKLATNSFDDSNLIGNGGSGTVFRGTTRDGNLFAVKRLDSNSLQTETEFQNELQILGGLRSPFFVTLLGYCAEESHRFLVYEYMPNKSLQELLFSENGDMFLNWERRFSIILDVAKALEFMHFGCDPPVIHGDIKPSNVLLDSEFRAKISDFGLSRVKIDGDYGVDLFSQDSGNPTHEVDFSRALQASTSSKSSRSSYSIRPLDLNLMTYNADLALDCESTRDRIETEGKEVWNNVDDVEGHEVMNDDVSSENEFDAAEHSKDLNSNLLISVLQDGNGELCSKDYVREWIGSQIHMANHDWEEEQKNNKPEKPELENPTITSVNLGDRDMPALTEPRFDTLEEEFAKEEIDERAEKNGTKKKMEKRIKFKNRLKVPHFDPFRGSCFHKWRTFTESSAHERGYDGGAEGEFGFMRDWSRKSGNRSMPSGELFSSTTSVRGTLCYTAPEYGGCRDPTEKGDIYSFGVLILVIISGQRPLNVLASPRKLEKANLVSWCRHLAQTGNVLELVDERMNREYDKERAELCVNTALACLQRTPALRPDIREVVRILKGET